jgi:diguanylate cyclase (GGDEF)-like protein
MPRLKWLQTRPDPQAGALEAVLREAGWEKDEPTGEGIYLILADRLDINLIPPEATDVLWWVGEATPEDASHVLLHRPGWVLRASNPVQAARGALMRLRSRELGAEGWLRQMLHSASLDELLHMVFAQAARAGGAEAGGIWVRGDGAYFQRAGAGFPEAPLSFEEAEAWVERGEADWICPDNRIGLLRLRPRLRRPSRVLAWIKEVENLLENAWDLERSRLLSFRDDLTLAQNRRCLEADLPNRVREAAARGESLGLLFVDVDNLKALNSAHGHSMGSRALERVAQVALGLIRSQDRLYRYGGDEFCILLLGASAQGAAKLGERLIERVKDAPLAAGSESVPLSVSIGAAAFPEHADGAQSLLDQADRALLRAKMQGKGVVLVAGAD